MGIRIDQVNLNSFAKVFPLKSDISDIVIENLQGSDSVEVVPNIDPVTNLTSSVSFNIKPATEHVLGGIKQGENISIDETGVLSVNTASATNKGLVQIGENIDVTEGVISIPHATNQTLGLVRVGEGIHLNSGEISVGIATDDNVGLVSIGENININDGEISVSTSSKNTLGLVKVGKNININDGEISVPVASENELGLVRAGRNISIKDGVISVIDPFGDATQTEKGVVQIGENINVQEGVISVNSATQTEKGVVQIGENLQVNNGIISVRPATQTEKGVLQVGENLNVADGVISSDISKDYVDEQIEECIKRDEQLEEVISKLEVRINEHETKISSLVQNIKLLQEYQLTSSTIIEELESRISLLERLVSQEVLSIRPLVDKSFYIGSVTLNGFSNPTKINLPDGEFTNSNYSVIITPNSASEGNLGEYWIEEKTNNSFTVVNTGRATMIRCDFLIMTNETHSKKFDATNFPYQKGSGTFNGSTGRQITLPNAMSDVNYKVMIMPCRATSTNFGELGEYWVGNKTVNGFKVYNSGADNSSKFDYIVIKTGTPVYHETTNPIMEGEGTFKVGGNIITFESNLSHTNYSVLVTPSENPGGDLGEYWITDKTTNTFKIVNTGSSTAKFDYIVVG